MLFDQRQYFEGDKKYYLDLLHGIFNRGTRIIISTTYQAENNAQKRRATGEIIATELGHCIPASTRNKWTKTSDPLYKQAYGVFGRAINNNMRFDMCLSVSESLAMEGNSRVDAVLDPPHAPNKLQNCFQRFAPGLFESPDLRNTYNPYHIIYLEVTNWRGKYVYLYG